MAWSPRDGHSSCLHLSSSFSCFRLVTEIFLVISAYSTVAVIVPLANMMRPCRVCCRVSSYTTTLSNPLPYDAYKSTTGCRCVYAWVLSTTRSQSSCICAVIDTIHSSQPKYYLHATYTRPQLQRAASAEAIAAGLLLAAMNVSGAIYALLLRPFSQRSACIQCDVNHMSTTGGPDESACPRRVTGEHSAS